MYFLKHRSLGWIGWFVLSGIACNNHDSANGKAKEEAEGPALFISLSPQKTRIQFNNSIQETAYANIFSYQYFYNGGGVAASDLNGDGLQDIYFSGNQVRNSLYLNRGNMQFEELAAFAGVTGRFNSWKTGVTVADVNGDGLPDIYQCYSGSLPGSARANQLFINQGNDKNGVPIFSDKAEEYGLADSSFSTQSAFFDYDRDGDLDMFLLNHNPAPYNSLDDITLNEIRKKPNHNMHSKLYRNDGDKFTDVSAKAGLDLSAFSYGLGVGIADINGDNWPDIYVCNDYSAPDYLLINNRNGTFTDRLKNSMEHTSLYSMGNDIGDINNDGLPDIVSLDMLPEDNKRQKLLFGPDNYEYFDMVVKAGFNYQYMRNMLQLNNGDGSFSEIGQLSGISNTDWSWAPLMADFDNDGWKDLFVSNGFLKDFTNMDFIKFRSDYFKYLNGKITPQSVMEVLSKMPSANITNYIFQNNRDLQFKDRSKSWGLTEPSNSNGAAYADLDNDGDLDLVVNNINAPAFVYQNQSMQLQKNHYLQLKLVGLGKNTAGFGAKVFLYTKGQLQYQEQMPARGYQSTVSPILHFGLANLASVDSLKILWLSGKQQVLQNIKTSQVLTLEEKNATPVYQQIQAVKTIFTETPSPVNFTHLKNGINDFKRQPLMINPQSFSGPCMARGDVNGDGLEDIFIGAAVGQAGAIYLQQKDRHFIIKENAGLQATKASEDADAVFFDANNDKALDLYVASGGYHNFLPKDSALQDHLFMNDGKGNFTEKMDALPQMFTSNSCVSVNDINGDGSPDLFLGGRVVPGRYPEIPQSYILMNDGKGKFTDKTTVVAPQLHQVGMVTDAEWHDLDGDAKSELILVGEWMPVTVFHNSNGKLTEVTKNYFEKNYSGWWNKILIADFNNDKHADIILANQGLNTQCKVSDKEPAEMYFKDFDDNGAVDPVLCFYIQGKSYPYLTRDELLDQVSVMRTRYQDYEGYANTTFTDVFTEEERKGCGHLTANYLQTAYFLGSADRKFKEMKLPIEVQFSPVFAMAVLDYNKDGALDLIMGGNINKARLRFGKYDANHGVLLKGDGKGNFTYVPQLQSGLKLNGDVRSIVPINDYLLFGINQMPVKAYKIQ